MPPRTRSKPYGPDSPNAAQGLPDPAPRRRRTTRSVSAQPQEEQPAQPLREPKTRKTRGKASSRGRKKVTRPTASASADGLQEEQLEASALSSDVNSQPQIETNRADDGTDDARLATPSVEVPATVLQSIETSEPETTAPTSTGLFSLQRKSDSRSRPQSGSAQLPSPSQSHVLRPQNASPIRRTRTPRSRRSSTHRTEGSESFSRTLFRLPELLSSHNEAEADSGQAVETNSAEQQEFVDASATVVARTESPAPAPATPKRERAASPVAPLTAPPAAVNGSPGWSRWIFNGVSRRWTVLRSRLNPEENDDEAHSVAASNSPTSFPPISQAAADRNEIAEDPEATADVKNIQAAVSASFPAPTVSIASRAVEKISNILSPRRIQARTSSTISASPRRRRRATSFVDARTLLNPDAPTSGQGYESQHSFVKRRQAARLAIEREQREARNRELADAKIAEAAVREATRRKALAAEFTTSLRPAIPHRRSTERPGQSEQGNPTSDITGQTATGSVPKANESNPRKRNRGFGLDEDDLAVHEEDFTPEEWNVLKVQVEKAEEEAAKAAQELAPPTKKRRVDENPQQQKRTRQSDRHNTSGTSRQTQPPARQPGFIPNKRGTFAPPDLPTIDSSRLMSDPDSPSNTKDPQTTPQTPSDDEINMPGAFHGSKSKTKNKDPPSSPKGRRRSSPLTVVPHYPARRYGPLSGYMANKLPGYVANKLHSKLVSENDIETENVNDEQGSSPLTRARNKAEQFKPKTPSRLRESARFPTSNQSTPAGLDMSSPSFSDAFQNSTPVQSRPLPVDDSPFLVHADKIPPLAGPTTSDSSLPRLQSEVFPAQAETEGSTAPLAAEVAWLSETLPDGQFDRLKWPSSREVIEHFRIDSNSLKIVNEESQPKGTDFAQYLQDLFENCGADPTGVPMSM